MININKQLKELYASKWDAISVALSDIANGEEQTCRPANPLLLQVDKEEKWKTADFKVMIFGQETNAWGNYPETMDQLFGTYNRFFHEGGCWTHGGQFWNGINKFEDMFNGKYPEKQICYLWNNIIKIGKETTKGYPSSNIREAELTHFRVIPDEIRILQPNVLLFITGPYYDNCIRDNFGELLYSPIEPYTNRQLAKLSIPNIDFAFRTYHPNYLWRHNIDDYFNAIINQI
jgi:hypothetical protein